MRLVSPRQVCQNWLLCHRLGREKRTNPSSPKRVQKSIGHQHTAGNGREPLRPPTPTIFAPTPLTCCYFWCPWAGVPVGQVSACRSEDGERRANSVVSETTTFYDDTWKFVTDKNGKATECRFLQNDTLTGSGLHPFILFLMAKCQKVFTTGDGKE